MLSIFEITHEDSEREWCTGSTMIEAVSNYIRQTGCHVSDLDNSSVVEIPTERWGDYTVEDEDGLSTFKEWMDANGHYGCDIIAGSMY